MIIQNLGSLSTNPRRRRILNSLPSVFNRLDPERVCRKHAESLSIRNTGKLYVIGFGKASLNMYNGLRAGIERRIDSAWIIVPEGQDHGQAFPELRILEGTHPDTGAMSVASTEEILDSIGVLTGDDTVIVLISGGGSALFEKPVDGITVEQISESSECLMRENADIYELNTFRRSFSMVKGGKLIRYLRPARVVSLIISDVYGDDPAFVASGPLSLPSGSSQTLSDIVGKYGKKCPNIMDMIPLADDSVLEPTELSGIHQKIILRNRDFVTEFCSLFEKWGVDYVSLGSGINGDVEEVSTGIMKTMRNIWNIKHSGFWFVLGGETTVEVSGNGSGGRNQELVLRMLSQMDSEDFLFLSIGTDGIDGKSPAMGGIVDSELRGKVTNKEIADCMENSDSYTLLNNHGCAIITGRTGNNVSDVTLGYIDFGSGS